MSNTILTTEQDSTGGEIDPESCSHAYGYDGSGRLITDTATSANKTASWVKTFTYDGSGRLTNESVWVRQ